MLDEFKSNQGSIRVKCVSLQRINKRTTLFRRKKIKIHFHKRTLKWNSTLACSCIAMASGKVAIQFKLEIKFSTHTYIGTKPFNPSEKKLLVKHWCIFMSLGQSKQSRMPGIMQLICQTFAGIQLSQIVNKKVHAWVWCNFN